MEVQKTQGVSQRNVLNAKARLALKRAEALNGAKAPDGVKTPDGA